MPGKKSNSISACLIVKDEEKNLDRCLKGLKADEIVVVDTGSKDKTKEIAKKYEAKVFNYKWKDDFSAARNFAVGKCTKDWILVVDADETISDKDQDKLKKLVKDAGEDIMGFALTQRNYTNDVKKERLVLRKDDKYEESEKYAAWLESPLVRLFRRMPKIKFEGEVHEVVENSIIRNKGKIQDSKVPIHHFKEEKGESFRQKKIKTYEKLGKSKVKKDPENHKAHFELGIVKREQEELDEAEEMFKKAISLKKDFVEAYAALGVVYNKKMKYAQAIKTLEKAVEVNPKCAEAFFSLGVSYTKKGQLDKAEKALVTGLNLRLDVNALNNLGAVYEKAGKYENALEILLRSLKIKPNATAFYNSAICWEKMGDMDQAAKLYMAAANLGHPKADEIKAKLNSIKQHLGTKAG